MNFIEASEHFYQDGCTVRTKTNIHTDDVVNGEKLMLKKHKILLVDGNSIVDIDYVMSGKYTRTNVHVVNNNYDCSDFVMKNGKCRLTGIKLSEIQLELSLVKFTVNQKKFSMTETQLLLENTEKSGTIIDDYKLFLRGIKSENTIQELLDMNIDLPQYGMVNDRLFIVNQDDEFINRMMIYEKCSIQGKQTNVLSLFKFGQDLQSMQSHILSHYMMMTDSGMQINVRLDNELRIIPDDSTLKMIPLKNSRYREYDMKSLVKMFDRKYEYGSVGESF